MERIALIDASFLVALLASSDKHHQWAESTAPPLSRPWLTCEAVLSESFYLASHGKSRAVLVDFLSREVVQTGFDGSKELPSVLALMEKYRDVPMSFADACLVRMTELLPEAVIFTTDSDFKIYRRHGRKLIPYIMPE
jgi:predicted nucleic acid-binding protein